MTRRSKFIAEKYRGAPCVVCGSTATVTDHIKAFKRMAIMDIEDNVWPLCVFGQGNGHHEEKHQIGINTFIEKYKLHDEMEKRGFEYDSFYGGWLKKF